jgi:hypothetical protein
MRSVKAYQQLKNTGLNLVVLKGGIKAWREAVPAQQDAQMLAPIIKPVKQSAKSRLT